MNPQEQLPEPGNPLGIDGIEFVEYTTTQPQALGALLEQMGFAAIARHRSREVILYRQGGMNVIANADRQALPLFASNAQVTVINALALRVRDANAVYQRALEMGAWAIPTRAGVMELNIPGVHWAGDAILYFVDRFDDFSIYDVDFKPIAHVSAHPPAIAGKHFFGVVQAVGAGRAPEWIDFYRQIMDSVRCRRAAISASFRKALCWKARATNSIPAGRAAAGLAQPAVDRTADPAGLWRARRAGRSARTPGARHHLHRPRTGGRERQGRTDAVLQGRREVRTGGKPPGGAP